MTKELALFLEKATEHCGEQECSIRNNYVGRGMGDNTTYAIVVDSPLQLTLNVIQYVKETAEVSTSLQGLCDKMPDVYDMGRLRSDNMGHQTVIY